MLSFGLLTLNTNNEKKYFMEIAKRAHILGIECFQFIPSNINPNTENVHGAKFNPFTNEWMPSEFPIPKILYDRCFYGDDSHSKQCKAIVKWLKTRNDILFLGYGLPNKLELYNALSKSTLSPYILPSKQVTSGESIIEHLAPHKPVMLKPINGSQGRGIYFLEKKNNELIVKTDKQGKTIIRTFPYEDKAISWINYLIKDRSYLIQAYKDLTNENNQPYDIRVLLQKDEHGNWHEMAKGIRTGKQSGIISNVSAGGTISPFENWLESFTLSKRNFLYQEMSDILQNLPVILEQNFPPLFELGIDLGVCKDHSIWILDINSKPGRKVALTINPSIEEKLHKAPLLYGKTLTKGDV